MMEAQDNLSLEGTEQEEHLQDAKQEEQPQEAVNEQTEQQRAEIPATQEEIVARLKEIAKSDDMAEKQELDALKQAFYKIYKNSVNEAKAAFVEAGGMAEDFLPAPNVLEDEFKSVMNDIKQKKAEALAALERLKEENLQKKLQILEQIKALSATPEEANQGYKEFKELQNQWKEIEPVPATHMNGLWKNYQLYVEQYYDQLKLNSEFREYDFKKNLEIKTRLCETAEKLSEQEDVIAAFQQLQALHQEYKETGPVAKELREELWSRFKAASTVINKRHQQYFEEKKAREEENLAHKTALCEKVETINFENAKGAEWEELTKQVLELQAEWRTVGFVPQKDNAKVFERFRSACDKFFVAKAEFFKARKDEQAQNLSLKTALCEKAEALKDSTDWKNAADTFRELQKEWKTIGAVPKKYSETLWKRFIGACDYFFEQKNKVSADQHSEERANLEKKSSVIERLNGLLESESENKLDELKALMKEWNEIGFVPFKEKDKIYKAYHEAVDKLYKALNMNAARKHLDNFKNNVKANLQEGGNALQKELERLTRSYEAKYNEIKTYENNLGFLTCSSKKGNSLVNEMNKKVEKLKDELALIKEKIKVLKQELS